MAPNQLCDEDLKALCHVFFKILQMDKVSFNKLLDWLDYHGIYSFESLIMSHEHGFTSAYVVNGKLQSLDNWIAENISSN